MNAGAPIIRLERLRELWIHTGTACNLSCPFCHEGSKPGDDRLQAPTLGELAPLLRQATAAGVERFVFTGGEPLILKGVFEILQLALELRPVLVLTNGTAPFIRRQHQLAQLHAAAHPLSFRVSIDSPDEAVHDAGRGLKNFRKALEGLRLLHEAGFQVAITAQLQPGEERAALEPRFRQLLRKQRLPEDLRIIALPGLGALGEIPARGALRTGEPVPPACTRGRMLLKRAGGLRFHACPLTDDADRFDLGTALASACAAAVLPDHPRCAVCQDSGVDYGGTGAA